MMRVLGLDLAMTATGMADQSRITTVKPTGSGDARLLSIVSAVQEEITDPVDLVVIEDLPTNAHSAGITGMVHGAVRHLLLKSHIPYALVSPATLKVFATGRGNCGKPDMAVAAYKHRGVEFLDDNQCDAWWLMIAGYTYVAFSWGMHVEPSLKLPSRQVGALNKAKWPELNRSTIQP